MPTHGLALVGFMGEQQAVHYLHTRCIPKSQDPAELLVHWIEAAARLGEPISDAGRPDIQEIPPEHAAHLQAVQSAPTFAEIFGPVNPTFRMVEIDPLLAYQFQVETDRSAGLCGQVADPSRLRDLLSICLPPVPKPIIPERAGHPNGMLIRSRDLNLRLMTAGHIGENPANGLSFAGIGYGPATGLIQVARFNGRCYLRNGFHRTYGLRKAGATHVPCVFIEAADFSLVGAVGGGVTFERALLESDNPPTCGHFTGGRALPVSLRRMSRILSVTWAEYVVPEE